MQDIDNILELIKQDRKNKKVRQQDIADHLGINIASYRFIENGKTKMKVEQLVSICEFLGLDIFKSPNEEKEEKQLVTIEPTEISKHIASLVVNVDKQSNDMEELKSTMKEILEHLKQGNSDTSTDA